MFADGQTNELARFIRSGGKIPNKSGHGNLDWVCRAAPLLGEVHVPVRPLRDDCRRGINTGFLP
jgi:hypothetical protein